jgi:hypothetical protein
LLSHYGLGSIINMAIPMSGPPHADQKTGCLSKTPGIAYEKGNYPNVDGAYGYATGGGPCERHDASFSAVWDANSVETQGSSYSYPSTRVSFLFGAKDSTSAVPAGKKFLAKLQQSASPYVDSQTVANAGHGVQDSPEGRAIWKGLILRPAIATSTSQPTPAPNPTANTSPPPAAPITPSATPKTSPQPSKSSPTPSSPTPTTGGGAATPAQPITPQSVTKAAAAVIAKPQLAWEARHDSRVIIGVVMMFGGVGMSIMWLKMWLKSRSVLKV